MSKEEKIEIIQDAINKLWIQLEKTNDELGHLYELLHKIERR